MTWWEDQNLLPAKIAGVEFFVEEITDQLGRRIVAPLLPGRDKRPGVVDLGKRAVGWQVSGYLNGNYREAYKKLKAAFNDTPGPYSFSNPYEGEFMVDLPDQPELRQVMDEGGRCTLRFTALVASEAKPFSEPIPTPVDRVRLAVKAAPELMEKGFEKRVPKKGFLDSLALAAEWISGLADTLDDARARAAALTNGPLALADAIQDLRTSAKQLAGLPGQLARSLGALLDSIFQLVLGTGGTGSDPAPQFETLGGADARLVRAQTLDVLAACATWDPYPPEDRTGLPAPQIEEIADAYKALVGGLALGKACGVLKDLPLESSTVAAGIGAQVLGISGELLYQPTIDDDTWRAIQDLQHAWATFASQASQDLPEVTTITLAASRPALMVAWELYQDPARGEDIADANGVSESTFLPAGVALQVLTR